MWRRRLRCGPGQGQILEITSKSRAAVDIERWSRFKTTCARRSTMTMARNARDCLEGKVLGKTQPFELLPR
jgi:hypothetical protein